MSPASKGSKSKIDHQHQQARKRRHARKKKSPRSIALRSFFSLPRQFKHRHNQPPSQQHTTPTSNKHHLVATVVERDLRPRRFSSVPNNQHSGCNNCNNQHNNNTKDDENENFSKINTSKQSSSNNTTNQHQQLTTTTTTPPPTSPTSKKNNFFSHANIMMFFRSPSETQSTMTTNQDSFRKRYLFKNRRNNNNHNNDSSASNSNLTSNNSKTKRNGINENDVQIIKKLFEQPQTTSSSITQSPSSTSTSSQPIQQQKRKNTLIIPKNSLDAQYMTIVWTQLLKKQYMTDRNPLELYSEFVYDPFHHPTVTVSSLPLPIAPSSSLVASPSSSPSNNRNHGMTIRESLIQFSNMTSEEQQKQQELSMMMTMMMSGGEYESCDYNPRYEQFYRASDFIDTIVVDTSGGGGSGDSGHHHGTIMAVGSVGGGVADVVVVENNNELLREQILIQEQLLQRQQQAAQAPLRQENSPHQEPISKIPTRYLSAIRNDDYCEQLRSGAIASTTNALTRLVNNGGGGGMQDQMVSLKLYSVYNADHMFVCENECRFLHFLNQPSTLPSSSSLSSSSSPSSSPSLHNSANLNNHYSPLSSQLTLENLRLRGPPLDDSHFFIRYYASHYLGNSIWIELEPHFGTLFTLMNDRRRREQRAKKLKRRLHSRHLHHRGQWTSSHGDDGDDGDNDDGDDDEIDDDNTNNHTNLNTNTTNLHTNNHLNDEDSNLSTVREFAFSRSTKRSFETIRYEHDDNHHHHQSHHHHLNDNNDNEVIVHSYSQEFYGDDDDDDEDENGAGGGDGHGEANDNDDEPVTLSKILREGPRPHVDPTDMTDLSTAMDHDGATIGAGDDDEDHNNDGDGDDDDNDGNDRECATNDHHHHHDADSDDTSLRRDCSMIDEVHLAAICKQILLILHSLHSKGIVHRDVRPKNFWITNGVKHQQCNTGSGGNCSIGVTAPLQVSSSAASVAAASSYASSSSGVGSANVVSTSAASSICRSSISEESEMGARRQDGNNCHVDRQYTLKLASFTSCYQFQCTDQDGKIRDVSSLMITDTDCLYWLAPEIIGGEDEVVEYDSKADVWSFGILVWSMLNGCVPPLAHLHNAEDIVSCIVDSDFQPRLSDFDHYQDYSLLFDDFLTKCLCRDVEKRWTSEQLLNHDFITKRVPNDASIQGLITEFFNAQL